MSFSCTFPSLVALVIVVPTSAPPPLLWWFCFLLGCVLGELIWVKNTPFFELLIFLNWDRLHDPVHHAVSWRAVLALLHSAVLGAGQSFLLLKLMAERNACEIGLSCFPCWCKLVRFGFYRKKKERTYILLLFLHATYICCISFLPPLLIKQIFLIFSSVFSKAAWFSAGFSQWPTIPNP